METNHRPSAGMLLRDYLKPYLRAVGGPANGRKLLELAKGLLQSKTTVLSAAGRKVLRRKGKTKGSWVFRERLDEWVKKMSNFLGKLSWEDRLMSLHFKRIRGRQKSLQLIVHDGSDINKRWAKEMEGLSLVRDGSTGDTVPGYTCFMSVGVGSEKWDLHPIDCTLINPRDEKFTSQGDVERQQITTILNHGIGLEVPHVFDRGFDDQKWFSFFDAELDLWLVRMTKKRKVLFRDERGCPIMVVAETLISESHQLIDGKKVAYESVWIQLEYDENGKKLKRPVLKKYTLIVVEREEWKNGKKPKEPMMLLSNGEVSNAEEALEWYLAYLKRWGVESFLRVFKQCLDIERMQLMTFLKLQSLLRLSMLLCDFIFLEYRKGKSPLSGGLFEELKNGYLMNEETIISSPYMVSQAIADLLQEEHRVTMSPPRHRPLRFRYHRKIPSSQLTFEFSISSSS